MFFVVLLVYRFCTLDAWFTAPLLSAHHIGTPVLLVKYNIDRDQKKPVSTVFIRGNEITQKIDVFVFAFIYKYTILAVTLEASVNGKRGECIDALL